MLQGDLLVTGMNMQRILACPFLSLLPLFLSTAAACTQPLCCDSLVLPGAVSHAPQASDRTPCLPLPPQVQAVLQAGVDADRIVFANACKRPKDMRAAACRGVDLTTFDTVSELQKLAKWHPSTAALLRIRADDPAARCQLGNKYGAEMQSVPGLLEVSVLRQS